MRNPLRYPICLRSAVHGAIAALIVVACSDDHATGPQAGGSPRPAFDVITQPTISATLTPTQSDQSLPTDTVVFYQDYTLVSVEANGLLQMSYSSAAEWGALAGTAWGPWDAGGGNGCTGRVHVRFAMTGFSEDVGFCDQSGGDPVERGRPGG